MIVLSGDGGHPDEWDERVAPLADFVERERGLAFEHPVTVEFLDADGYADAVRIDDGALTAADREAMEEWGAVLEALGILPAGTDPFASTNDLVDTGTLAFYDPVAEVVNVRGTEMSVGLEATLVHELVHVAQDQAFDLTAPLPDDSTGAREAFDALVEGDASRIEMAYVSSLDGDRQDAYWDEYSTAYDESQQGLSDVPGALQALFAAPYVLGTPLVELIVDEGGNAAVDDAFAEPPASSEHLLDPRSYFAGDQPVDVDQPDLPDGGDEVGEPGPIGATTLYVLLAERIDPLDALAAADGWGGDNAIAYDDGERTCVRADLVGDTPEDTDEIARALRDWAAVGSPGAASVEADADLVSLEACASQPDGYTVAPSSRGLDTLGVPAARSQVMVVGAQVQGLDHEDAFAFGDCVVHDLPFDTLVQANEGDAPPEVAEAVDATMQACATG
ncbi:MAG: hypothetical protein JXA83_08145 [Acidimicrobiales bacterium]|nr:hypothetical protein [Acidimicrobiales bacterium]